MKLTPFALLVLMVAVPAGAQSWVDGFNYTNGTTIGTWKEYLGNWTCNNGEAVSQSVSKYQHLVQPTFVLRDCVVQCVAITKSKALQLAGPTLRVNNPGSGSFGADLVLIKVQDNNSDGLWDYYYLYEHKANGTLAILKSGKLPTTTARAVVRLTALDQRLVGQIDCNGDGKWDVTAVAQTTVTAKAGPIGVAGHSGSAVDDVRLYDAVLLFDPSTTNPKIGTEFKMVMRGWASAPYVAASSLGNRGIVLSSTSAIPLSLDNLLVATAQNWLPTIFKNFAGTLDTSGNGRLSIQIPKDSALVGVTLFTAFVNYRTSQILTISNDFQFAIRP